MTDVLALGSTRDFPGDWDDLAHGYFQKREFLAHCEEWNPCRQRYYVARDAGATLAGAMVYTLDLDLLTYTRASLPIQAQIIGIPCSVSSSGLIGEAAAVRQLLEELRTRERGLLLTLNLPSLGVIPDGLSEGHTLPTLRIERPSASWDDYLGSLRSDYRRRIGRILKRSSRVAFHTLGCSEYTDQHHELYLQVLGRSEARLERLSADFVRHLPDPFRLIVAEREGRLAGWALVLNAPEAYTFVLGGLDYEINREEAVYLRLLVEVVRSGIDCGARAIELGQTAEIPKLRLGGVSQPLYMAATHSNRALRGLLRAFAGLLEYRRPVPAHHVFRGQS